MKKLTVREQKKIVGGGPCGKQLCGDIIVEGATYTGPCSSNAGCTAAYLTSIICSGGAITHTYCTTGLIPP